jgi:L-threonylcarbamoyladenylate synthase
MSKRSSARIYRPTPRNLALLAGKLRAGELVAVPTETVYGLAANALDPDACARIFRAKRRPQTDPLIVHIHSLRELPSICRPSDTALSLAKAFWPGPLTLVLPKTSAVPDIVTAGNSSVAVRMPRHPVFRELLRQAGLPLAAPSANPFGYISPTRAEHVRDGLGAAIDYILDGGPSDIGLESTILDLRDARRPRLLRPGAVTRIQLEKVLRKKIRVPLRRNTTKVQLAPGMLARHYSPRIPLTLHAAIGRTNESNEAYVFFRQPPGPRKPNVFWLDAKGSLAGAAHRLFSTLRRLDRRPFRRIHIELATGDGLADAINDRLRRAAAR